jgi:DNA-binding LacI/PurR family transcriptional regulator/DNA-binding transcriptional regulator YhcF (GntR family)
MRDTPAQRKAYTCILKRCAEQLAIKKQVLLPPMPQLAKDAGISPRTVGKVLHQLRRNGILALRRGRGFAVTASRDTCLTLLRRYSDACAQHTATSVHTPAYRAVARQIETDIITGEFLHERFVPPVTQLQYRYHRSHPTCKKALEQCVGDGLLENTGNRYRIVRERPGASSLRICFVKHGNKLKHLSLDAIQGLTSALNTECVRRNIQLQMIGWYHTEGKVHFFMGNEELPDLPLDKEIAAYITLREFDNEKMDALLRRLSHVSKPVAVLDNMGNRHTPSYLKKPHIRIFTTAKNTVPGLQVGHYLGGLGHRHVAYISPFHQSSWSQMRLQGLQESLRLHDTNATITPCVFHNPAVINTFYQGPALHECDLDSLLSYFRNWQQHNPSYLRPILEPLITEDLPRRLVPTAFFNHTIRSLFSHALDHDRITAWVAANDQVAIQALHFLNEKAMKPPRPISLVGFDDNIHALQEGVTSYNFNRSSLVHLATEWILNGRHLPASLQKSPSRVKGMVVKRLTTGRPPE